jgi:DNA polymerase III alpha subunit
MIVDLYGQHVYDEGEVFDILMRSEDTEKFGPFLLKDPEHNIERTNLIVGYEAFVQYENSDLSVEEFDKLKQAEWWMPDEYKEMDIAAVVLDLCETQEELQRCGAELLLFQEKGLFDLLRYLKYLVDLMELNDVIWGVGRGSSVASYVLYKLKVHKINSMYYDLDIREFLR